MGISDVYLTKEGHEKLIKELDYLRTVRRRELSAAIGQARELGDISENAEYDAAKEAQGMNEKRIAELEIKLSNARIIDYEDIPKDQILLGAKVKLKDLKTAEEFEYTLVSELESDFEQGRISVSSPVGQALLGHKEKEIIEIHVPAGILKYEVLQISRSRMIVFFYNPLLPARGQVVNDTDAPGGKFPLLL